ncbi:MAG: DNA mismatch repair protein MutS [Candidatus Aminicenantes bacterium]|nr:DNA mismatch repair protein MutS [Candidatus Aminicenantes bacterium]
MTKNKSATPMMEQYLKLKKRHKDAFLFFRMGDFYELFYEDAQKASSILDIALTSRQKVPMCGVPHHSADSYLSKLLKNGHKVAVCEQVEDPKKSKGVVKRDVVKVLTPGTAVEIETEDLKESTYVMSVVFEKEDWGMALIDLASGQMNTAQSEQPNRKNLKDEMYKYSPREVIFPQSSEQRIEKVMSREGGEGILKSSQEDWIFDAAQASDYIKEHFKVSSLEGFGIADKKLAVSAAGALLYYLKKLRKGSLSLIQNISYLHTSHNMILDAAAVKNLELVKNLRDNRRAGSLLDIIDFTVNSMGSRLLRSWLLYPSLSQRTITERQDGTQDFLSQTIERHEIRENLKQISDLERLSSRISLSAANAKDLVSLKVSLQSLPSIKAQLKPFQSSVIKKMKKNWDNAEDLVKLIDEAVKDEPSFLLKEGGIIKKGFNQELDELRQISMSGKTFITGLEKKERERTQIPTLKVRFNKVFGYFIQVTKSNLSRVPDHYIRKQTLVNSERFITPELKEHEQKILHAEERINELEYKLFQEVRDQVSEETSRLKEIASQIALLDVLTSLAELASQRSYNRPQVNSGDIIRIKEGRHPVIEVAEDDPFVPNDAYLDRDDDQILIITGPNMGGKSTYLRQVALICILAQMGSYVPAEEAEVGLVDRIFTRIGAMDFLSLGQSTFMVEMLETAGILNNATNRSLILLDEVGRGTSTFDGLSLAWAVVEYLHESEQIRAKTLFATHYHELTELAMTMDRIKNYHVSVKEWKGDIIFLRKIVSGPSDQSYGIHVAKLAGIPRDVLERAKELLFNLEQKELDSDGIPKISYHQSEEADDSQMFLFGGDRNYELWTKIRDEIKECDVSQMTPLDALNWISRVKKKIENDGDG